MLGLLGVLWAGLTTKKRRSAPAHDAAARNPDEADMRRLAQLKGQLKSGLISDEEYETKRQEILKEL